MSREEQVETWDNLNPAQQKTLTAVLSGQPAARAQLKSTKSNGVAFLLGLLLGPVGLWYKGHWVAGFAWLAMAIVFSAGTFFIAAPVFWLGMAIHAAVAEPRD